jgi:hypothetical protein
MTEQTEGGEVEALRALLAALRYGSHTFTTHEMAERILASDWLAADRAAERARGAQAVLAAVEAIGWYHLGDDYYAGAMEHAKEDILRAARAAAAAAGGGA